MKKTQQFEIKQMITYAPIAGGGQKLAALDEKGRVCIWDDAKEEWTATNHIIDTDSEQEGKKYRPTFIIEDDGYLVLKIAKTDFYLLIPETEVEQIRVVAEIRDACEAFLEELSQKIMTT